MPCDTILCTVFPMLRGVFLILALALVCSCVRFGMKPRPDAGSAADLEPSRERGVGGDAADAGVDNGAKVDSAYVPWSLPLWSFRRTITIGGRAPAATLSDFPVLIDIRDDASLRERARSDGHDVRFTTEEGVTLEHETETYDPATGSLLAWVKLPSLDTGSDTRLLLYYGNGAAENDPSVTTVWNEYAAVWHLGESSTGAADELRDSSSGGNHARGGGGEAGRTPARVKGKIGSAQDADGVDDLIVTPLKLAGESLLTVTAWFRVRQTDNTVRPGLLGQNDALEIGFFWPDHLNVWTPNTKTTCPGKTAQSACTPDFSLDTWTHLAVVFDGASSTLYIDGVKKHASVAQGVGSSDFFFCLMGRIFDGAGNHLDGTLDEVRVANVDRSAAWIAVQHATQADPASFYSLGPEQQAL